jgi:hypothetical protein
MQVLAHDYRRRLRLIACAIKPVQSVEVLVLARRSVQGNPRHHVNLVLSQVAEAANYERQVLAADGFQRP